MDLKNHKHIELIIAVLLLAAIFFVRFNKLEADPPIGLSASSDVYTDHGQYTYFAKNKITTGDFNPLNDHRFVFFEKSTVTILSLIVFKLFGVSLYSNNLVGLLFSFGALFCFYLIIRKVSNWLTGILFLLLIGLNYNLVFYGKLPFLEHAMVFWGFLALVIVLYLPKWFGYILGGLSLGLAIFFSKIIGIVFLFPFACYFAYQYFYVKKEFKQPLFFLSGFISVVIFWLFFSYFPSQSQVSGYVGEQALSLYGAPEAFNSLTDFFWKMMTFGEDSHLFGRMFLPAILALVFLGKLFIDMLRVQNWRKGFEHFNSGQIFIAALIIGFFFSLMIWNYRPLRYQLVLIYPFYGAAAIILGRLWSQFLEKSKNRITYLVVPILYIMVLIPTYQIVAFAIDKKYSSFHFADYRYQILLISALIAILIFAVNRLLVQKNIVWPKLTGKIIVISVLAFVSFKGIADYAYWNERATFTARDNGFDVGKILSKKAILSGPYANLLAYGNENKTIIHMFGVSEPDPDLFVKYPITHLLLDDANEKRAKADYPNIMDSASHILTYHVGLKKVRLYRVAGYTGNARSDGYRESNFERLVGAYDAGEGTLLNNLAVEILTESPDNISCYEFLAEAAVVDSLYPLADVMFKKAVEFSPTNYNLKARIAKFYENWYKVSNQRILADSSVVYYDQAILFAPTVSRLYTAREELLKSVEEK